MSDIPADDKCKNIFSGILGALHNQCLYSNALYLLTALFALAALPGWWKIIGVALLLVSVISYIHHTQEQALLGAGVWGKLDSGLASTLVVTGMAMLVGLMARPDTRASVGPFFGAAVILLAVYSLGLFYISQVAARKAGGAGDATKGWGGGPLLAEEDTTSQPVICSQQRYQIDYLSLHSTWHGLSAAGILLMIVALRRALVEGKSPPLLPYN